MIASDFAPSIGGIQAHTLRLSQLLAAKGARVLVVTRGYRGLPREERMGDVLVVRVGTGDAPLTLSTGTYVAGALQVLWRRRLEIDVLHAHQMFSPMSIALLARLLWRVPIVVNPHLSGMAGDVMQLVGARPMTGPVRLAAARRYVDAFVAISDPIRKELHDAGMPNARIVEIPNGVDCDAFYPAEADEKRALRASLGLDDRPLAVYTGRLERQKGVDVLLNAWASVAARHPDACLALIGDGKERHALEEQSVRLRIAGRVRFAGATTDVVRWLRAADVFVLPSRAEGMSIALLEAMACGLPVVATAVGGTPDVLRHGRNGYIVPPDDPDALSHEITQAIDGRFGVGAMARAEVLARFPLSRVADRVLELYSSLAAIQPARVPTGAVR